MRDSILRFGAAVLLLAGGALAETIDRVKPECAAPGDAVLILGSGFGTEPTILFGQTEAEILRAYDEAIVCRVPRGLAEGPTTIHVGDAAADFHVLAQGAPAIVHASAETATPGMLVFFVGARFRGATAAFENGDGDAVATVDLRGGTRVAYLKVPLDLEAGTYTVRIANAAGDSGPCSPTLAVVEPGAPTLVAIEPEEQLPGRPVFCKGTDLGPFGFCFLTWTDAEGNDLFTFGFANGYGLVHSWVPDEAQAGATYDVVIDFRDGSSTADTGAFAYTVGTPPPPVITGLEYDKGPPGSALGIFGENLVGSGFAPPVVEFTRDGVSTEAFVFYFHFKGFHGGSGEREAVFVEVPRSLEDGECDVTVTVHGQTSNAATFTVGRLPLTVTSMHPDSQGPHGPQGIVVIEGTGFGVVDHDLVFPDPSGGGGAAGSGFPFDPRGDPFEDLFEVKVTWENAAGGRLLGLVLWHTDREILVVPPGGWHDPLPVGEYTVFVTVDREGATETVEAGPYTVRARHGTGKPGPFSGTR